MPLPRSVARFNKRYTNRFIEPLVRRSSGFAVVHHIGRTSHKPYKTPVNVFLLDGDLIVALTYGPSADWVKNVQAGDASVDLGASVRRVRSVQTVDRTVAWPALPRFVRFVLRMLGVRDFLRMSLGDDIVATG